MAMIGTGICFKKSIILSIFQAFPINSLEYRRPMYEESNQNMDMAIINTASINPGIAIPINAIKVNK